jgi:hypothetical protein
MKVENETPISRNKHTCVVVGQHFYQGANVCFRPIADAVRERQTSGMKSYFLDDLTDEDAARVALSQDLPNWTEPWLLKDEREDVVAYFEIVRSPEGKVSIQADLSGRHHWEDDLVLRVLQNLKGRLGGVVTDEDDNAIG